MKNFVQLTAYGICVFSAIYMIGHGLNMIWEPLMWLYCGLLMWRVSGKLRKKNGDGFSQMVGRAISDAYDKEKDKETKS